MSTSTPEKAAGRSLSLRACLVPTRIETGYRAREQFVSLHARRQRWAVSVAHRRAGKTVACINDLIDGALRCQLPEPRFAYVAPYFSQAKDVAWSYLKRYTAPIPGNAVNESELRVDLPNQGRVRLYGADNYERLRGIYLDGVVLDEYGDMDPRAWQEAIRPALADRKGWAIFIGTPRGLNHFADLWERAQSDPEWYPLTLKASETGLLPAAELEQARREMSEEQYAAEFECSFAASVVGAYYGREMQAAETEGRITRVPVLPEAAVDTWWDLGVNDATAIWFTQSIGREVHVVDYYESSGEGLPHYAKVLQDRGYVYGQHNAPHDIQVRELGSGRSRIETARGLGINFRVVPDVGLMDGIDAARMFIGRCWFDREKTERGRLALTSYRKIWDEKRRVFQARPMHDWASNGADGFRYLAVGHKFASPRRYTEATPRLVTVGSGSDGWMGA
ncbi:MAG TPA: terminase family protein [Stellaceae bacterium]|nr:terminase family protein [Stellaceae bacterium]